MIDLLSQLSKIVQRNSKNVLKSWSSNCSWLDPRDNFKDREVHLVLSLDGASVFRSRNISVWPVWVQLLNLPPLLRSKNLALAALWHGPHKPNFKVFLTKIVFEFKTVLNRTFDFEEIRFVARSIVCDMPATAYCLSMYQHMGYFTCTFCLIKGIRHNNRMIFPVKAPVFLCKEESFIWCAQQSVRRSRPVLGIKDISPFNGVFSFPKDAPIDAMHQVFLGTGKVLTK